MNITSSFDSILSQIKTQRNFKTHITCYYNERWALAALKSWKNLGYTKYRYYPEIQERITNLISH